MIWFMIFLIVCSVSFVRPAHIPENDLGDILRPASKIWHKQCTLITGATEEQIEELKQGKFADDENIQKYVSCLGLISGVIKTDITFDEKLVKHYLPDNLEYKLAQHIECLNAAKNIVLKDATKQIWHAVQCAYKKDPEKFLMF
ncbi:uncharacterized protein [Leptinotarsa decemlineata]|uniref:uncharacterized protein n=1 Tax=Leptinotarsa decemlineata TaxID=7539 RepID=UPI000C252235|nr:uncharacterized protein LOC111512828 [Leptinotarsa decemlineata]